jgi:hypothetical protein
MDWSDIGVIVAFLILIGLYVLHGVILEMHTEEYDVVVVDKCVKRYGKHDYYLIFCRDLKTNKSLVFVNKDSWLYWKFNSSDVYMDIQVGKKYHMKVAGYRVPMLSWYPNIVEYREIK